MIIGIIVSIICAITVALAMVITVAPLRKQMITQPFLHWFQRENPPLSTAERQVIEAGGASWVTELFTGDPHWSTFLTAEKLKLTPAEQDFLDNEVVTLCRLLDEWQISHEAHDLPKQAWDLIKNRGFWALEMDPQYGGHGFSPLAHATIIGKIASVSISTAITVMVPNSLGPAEFLKNYGMPEQKKYYLPRLARGEEIACFALTGVEAGSDAASIADVGVVCVGEYEGKSTLGIRLTWNKRYITLAPIATLIGLAFRLFDPEHLLGDVVDRGITLALIPAHLPGIEQGHRHSPLNMGFMNGPLRGQDVFIPLEQIIGGVQQIGKGWQMMMECLVVGRGISLPSVATSMAQFCMRMSSAYALVRQQFHRPILQFEGIQQALGKIGGLTYISGALHAAIVDSISTGARPAVVAALSKYHLTELARQIVADSMDIHAGYSIQLGKHNYLSQFYAAAPINITVEGANILTRNLMIYGQGVLRCHPYLHQELTAAMDNDVGRFDKLFCSHVAFIVRQFSRSMILGVTNGRWIRPKIPAHFSQFSHYFRQLTRMSNALVVLTDVTLLVLGKRLKAKEALSARLGDVLSYLYIGLSVVKYYQDRGQQPDEHIFLEWSMDFCFNKIAIAIIEFLANFPVKGLARVMRWLIFPWGNSYPAPTDSATALMAHALCQNMPLRERLSRFCHVNSNSSAQKMEEAMRSILNASPLLEKIRQLMGKKTERDLPSPFESHLALQVRYAYQKQWITEDEHDQLKAVADLCWEAIQVDEFERIQ